MPAGCQHLAGILWFSENLYEETKEVDRMKNNILLVLTALIWGCAFVAQSVGMDYVGPFTFNMARFLIGAIVADSAVESHWLLPVLCSNGASYLRRLEKPDSSQLCIL